MNDKIEVKVEKIEQYWIPQIINNCEFPFLVVDNWFTPNELTAVWKELDFYLSTPKEKLLRAASTVAAKDPETKKSLSESYRFYPDSIYAARDLSPILNYTYKQRSREFHQYFEQMLPWGNSFLTCNKDSAMVSYYEDNDYYKHHHDTFMWTCLIWLYKEPKQFDGGDLHLADPDTEIKLKNNRMVMFPSCYSHAVSPIKFKSKLKELGWGRFCITHFYYAIPGKFDENWNFSNE